MKRRGGFTLVEMMVSMAILLVLAVYLTQMLVNQSRAYTVVERVTETQQNLRVVSQLLEQELRGTSLLVPGSAAVCGLDRTDGSDILFVTDTAAIDNPDSRRDWLSVGFSNPSSYDGDEDSVTLELAAIALDTPSYDTDGDGTSDSDFLATTGAGPNRQGGVFVVDQNNPQRGASCGIVLSVDPGANEIDVDFDLADDGNGSPLQAHDPTTMGPESLVAIPAHVYQVQNGQLLRDGLVLADDVEDLQVSYFFDADGDLEEDAPGETPGAAGAAQYDPTAWNHTILREVRVSLVARTRAQDAEALQRPGQEQGTFQTTANRADPGNPPDGFRRRVHTASVRPRNVGRRPPIGG